jgi:hypothetical protein
MTWRSLGCGPRAAGAALAAGLWLASCAPAHDPDRLFTDLRSRDPEAQQDAAERLERIVREGDHSVFVRGLSSPDINHYLQSILYLARMPQPGARAAMRDLLRVDRRRLIPYNPIRMKPTSERTDSRILVAHLIAQGGGDPQAAGALIEGADPKQPAEVVTGTCYALGALRDPAGIPYLMSVLEHPDPEAVRAAVQSLGRFKEPAALEGLARVVRHPSLMVRSELLSALEGLEPPAGESLVHALAASDPEPDVRAEALRGLGRFHDTALVPFLIEQLRAPHPAVRGAALGSLQRLTRQALGPDPGRWSRWWAQNGGRPRPGR